MTANVIITILALIVWLLFSIVYAFMMALGSRRARRSRVREVIDNIILLPVSLLSFLFKKFS